ncbi:Eisosome 1 protein [Pleurostoma richardsiae]|uniref:Eisosome 1 protein n=1 Tax=Pleurostoma richardsiae TaxID=41990 RepID=A0AA38RMN1_9PEZI|nr:Eisosome 1 protein [Pleurostoma richardsiae]
MAPSWQPERTPAGSRAAVLAAEAANRSDHRPTPPNSWGSSAANHAFKTERSPPPSAELTTLNRERSLRAAKGAMAGSRPRSRTLPVATRQSGGDDTGAALSAATTAHRPSTASTRANVQATGAVPFTTMDRRMFTSNPPLRSDTEDKQRADSLHASAVAMAKRMYTQQQRVIEQTKLANEGTSRGRSASFSSDEVQPMRFNNLQEAAYKLAQERLAKLQEEHQRNRETSELQEYYATPPSPTTGRRFSIRNKLRRRASSDGEVVEDRKRSQQIRAQMSLFSEKIVEVDEQKRQRDREALLAAAQRNVKAQLQGMDEKVFKETGMVAPSMLSEWELKAHAAAQARSEQRKSDNYGKVDIGAGRFMDQKEVDEIAAKRVQPVLDEINEKAEEERERQIALKMEQEAKQREIESEKARDKEIKDIYKKLKEQNKDEEKAKRAELKQEEKARKEEEKAAKAEKKRTAKEGKDKHKEIVMVPETGDETAQEQPAEQPATEAEEGHRQGGHLPAILSLKKIQRKDKDKDATLSPEKHSPPLPEEESPASPTSKMRNWLRSRFTRPRARSSPAAQTTTTTASEGGAGAGKKGFIGGAALANLGGGTASATSLNESRTASVREVALAGRQQSAQSQPGVEDVDERERDKGLVILPLTGDEPGEGSGKAAATGGGPVTPERRRSRSLGSVSSLTSSDGAGSDGEHFVEARDDLSGAGGLSPPKPFRGVAEGRLSASPDRGSKFLEMME